MTAYKQSAQRLTANRTQTTQTKSPLPSSQNFRIRKSTTRKTASTEVKQPKSYSLKQIKKQRARLNKELMLLLE